MEASARVACIAAINAYHRNHMSLGQAMLSVMGIVWLLAASGVCLLGL